MAKTASEAAVLPLTLQLEPVIKLSDDEFFKLPPVDVELPGQGSPLADGSPASWPSAAFMLPAPIR